MTDDEIKKEKKRIYQRRYRMKKRMDGWEARCAAERANREVMLVHVGEVENPIPAIKVGG